MSAAVDPLHPLNQREQRFTIHEPNRLAGGKLPSIPGEVPGTDDDDLARILGREDTVHFAYGPHANASAPPVLALDEVQFAVLAQPDIDAAVWPRAFVLDNAVAIPAIGFSDKRCGGGLVLRTATRGQYAGRQFLGCETYPRCRYIENLPTSAAP